MSALTDLQSKLSAASDTLSKLSSDVDAFIAANSGGATDADLLTLGSTVDSLTSQLQAVDAKLAPPTPPAAS